MASSNTLDERRYNTAVRAFPSATGIDPSWVLSSRAVATTYPPVSTTVMTTKKVFFSGLPAPAVALPFWVGGGGGGGRGGGAVCGPPAESPATGQPAAATAIFLSVDISQSSLMQELHRMEPLP